MAEIQTSALRNLPKVHKIVGRKPEKDDGFGLFGVGAVGVLLMPFGLAVHAMKSLVAYRRSLAIMSQQ